MLTCGPAPMAAPLLISLHPAAAPPPLESCRLHTATTYLVCLCLFLGLTACSNAFSHVCLLDDFLSVKKMYKHGLVQTNKYDANLYNLKNYHKLTSQ